MNTLKHWFFKYIMPAFEPAKVKNSELATLTTRYSRKEKRNTTVSWGSVEIKLRKPYR